MASIPKPRMLLSAGFLSISLVLAPTPQELVRAPYSASSNAAWVDRGGEYANDIGVPGGRIENEIRQVEEERDEEILQGQVLPADREGVVGGESTLGEPTEEYEEIPEEELEAGLAGGYEEAEEALMATYYGEEFAGAPTTSGESHDPNGLMAAHPYLPLGTELLVSYDGKDVVVVVNDRCLCGLDLSWAAALQIGLTDAGAALVDTELL